MSAADTSGNPPRMDWRLGVARSWPAGWGWPDHARVPHYFLAGEVTSLCGSHDLGGIGRGPEFATDGCARCRRKLAAHRSVEGQP